MRVWGTMVWPSFTLVLYPQVAIKRINSVFSNTTDAHRILREIYILRNLRHLNIIQLIDIPLPPSYTNFQDLYLVGDLCFVFFLLVVSSGLATQVLS